MQRKLFFITPLPYTSPMTIMPTTIIRQTLKNVATSRFVRPATAQSISDRIDALSDQRVIEIHEFINSPAQLRDCGIDNGILRTRGTVLQMIKG